MSVQASLVANTEETGNIQAPSQDTLKRLNIKLLDQNDSLIPERSKSIRLVYTGFQAVIATYHVIVWPYLIVIHMLNLPVSSPMSRSVLLGTGTFGKVKAKLVDGTEFAAKIIDNRGNSHNVLEEVIWEVAVSKLAAALKIGPEIITDIPFDVISYQDTYQFHMEKCASTLQHQRDNTLPIDSYEKDIKYCIKVLHSLHIVHQDIKPANTLCSVAHQRYVLSDFGCCKYIKENIGEKSRTGVVGTPRFMGKEMKFLRDCLTKKARLSKDIDLYDNDIQSYQLTIQWLVGNNMTSPEQNGSQSIDEGYPIYDLVDPLEGEVNITYSTKTVHSYHEIRLAFQRPDAFKFYKLIFAATDLKFHNFNFKQNLPELGEPECQFIYDLLIGCLNRDKVLSAITELEQLAPQQNSLWGSWLPQLKRVFEENFVRHTPRIARIIVPNRTMIRNYMRLFGKQRFLEQSETKLTDKQSEEDQRLDYEVIIKKVRKLREDELQSILKEIDQSSEVFCRNYGVEQQQEFINKLGMSVAVFCYQRKRYMLEQLLKVVKDSKDPIFLNPLAAILRKDRDAAHKLESIQVSLEMRMCLVSLHYQLTKEASETMLKIYANILEELSTKPTEFFFIEIINVRRLQFLAKVPKMDSKGVEQYFQKGLELLSKYTSHEDAFSILRFLQDLIRFSQIFQFPLAGILRAHLVFEWYRQYYSEITNIHANQLILKTYEYGVEMESDLSNAMLEQIILSNQQRQYFNLNKYRTALKQLEKTQSEGTASYPKDLIYKAHLHIKLRETDLAESLLVQAEEKVAKSIDIRDSLNLYKVKAELDILLRRFNSAQENCKQAMYFNSKLCNTRSRQEREHLLKEMLVRINYMNEKYPQCIELLSQTRSVLEAEYCYEYCYHFRKIAQNYLRFAEVFLKLERFNESRFYCKKVYTIAKDREGLIDPQLEIAQHIMKRVERKHLKGSTDVSNTKETSKKPLRTADPPVVIKPVSTSPQENLSVFNQLYEPRDVPINIPITEFLSQVGVELEKLPNHQRLTYFTLQCRQLNSTLITASQLKCRQIIMGILMHQFELSRSTQDFVPLVGKIRDSQEPEQYDKDRQLLIEIIGGILRRHLSPDKPTMPVCPRNYRDRAQKQRVAKFNI